MWGLCSISCLLLVAAVTVTEARHGCTTCPRNACSQNEARNGFCNDERYVSERRTCSYRTSTRRSRRTYYKCGWFNWLRCERRVTYYRGVTKYETCYQRKLDCKRRCCSGFQLLSNGNCEPYCSRGCHNGGVCIDPEVCRCPSNWQGKSCTVDVNECESNNGGCSDYCSNMAGSYRCHCRDFADLDQDRRHCTCRPGFSQNDTTLTCKASVQVKFSQPLVTTTEEEGQASITVRAMGDLSFDFSIIVKAVNGTAVEPFDFTWNMWRVDFPAGATEAGFIIPIVQDTITEPPEEFSLKIAIESPFNETVTVVEPSRQTVHITDCPVDQILRFSKMPPPTCDNRKPVEEMTASFRCFCADGSLFKDDTCVIPYDCKSVIGAGVGDPHYHTYDGLSYDLFDHCSHIFTKDCADETFTVISITGNKCSGGGAATCIEKAIIQVPELNTQVVLSGQPLQSTFIGDTPPTTELSVVVTSRITVTIFELGVVVNFKLYDLSVTIPGSYFGKMCGLLGNNDGNHTNEYQLPNGTVVNDPTPDFELAWRVDHANDDCDHFAPEPVQPCEGTARKQAETFCAPLHRPNFTDCHASISPDQTFTDCVLDHCICETDICGCTVILKYAERCQALGNAVGPIPDVCVPTCPEGQVYNICSPNLPPTCTDQAGQSDPCRPGCACPTGTVMRERDKKCVDPVLCDGTIVIPAVTGFRSCNAWGDPHYITFDGQTHHFQGVCFFNFASDCKDHLFHVYSHQERCYTQRSCTTGVIIEVKGYAGRIEIGQNGTFSPDISTLPANIFQVMHVGHAYTVNIVPLQITVYYDGIWTLGIKIPDPFFGGVCGLCGNANGNMSDDFQALVDGSLQQVTDITEFGLSWANFNLSEEYDCEVSNVISGPCEGSKRRRAEEFCRKLRTKAISTGCIHTINPLEFINNCMFDYCASEIAPGVVDDLSAVCSHFILYCKTCSEALGTLTDVPAECLPECAEREVYKTCGPAQEGTCVDPMPIMQTGTCTPGCSCMEGLVRHEGNCINVTGCPVTVRYQCSSYSVKEGDGVCLPIEASGNLSRDFEVTVNLGKQFAADGTGNASCSCKSQVDAQVCGGSDSCNVSFKAGEAYACVYIKMDENDILDNDRTETLTLTSGDDSIIIKDQGQVALLVIDDDYNRLTFEATAYYFTESFQLEPNHHVRLSQAPDAPVFAKLQVEGGDGVHAATDGYDFRSGVIQPHFVQGSSGLRALFHVHIVNDKLIEDAECFYMTLHSPRKGSSYDPEIRAWMPSRAIGWIESESNRLAPTNGTGGYTCFHATVSSKDVCRNDIIALVTFDSEIDSKDCKLGWKATVRTVIKGGALIPQTAVNIYVLPVRGCNTINFKWGEHYLVAGSLETAGGFGVFVHDVHVSQGGHVIWDSMQYAPVLEEIKNACG